MFHIRANNSMCVIYTIWIVICGWLARSQDMCLRWIKLIVSAHIFWSEFFRTADCLKFSHCGQSCVKSTDDFNRFAYIRWICELYHTFILLLAWTIILLCESHDGTRTMYPLLLRWHTHQYQHIHRKSIESLAFNTRTQLKVTIVYVWSTCAIGPCTDPPLHWHLRLFPSYRKII